MGEYSAGLSYGDLALRVDAPRDMLAWLEEFLGPAFACGAPQRDAVVLRVRADTAAYRTLLDTRPSHTAELDCFVNDSHIVRLPSWHTPSGTRIAWQEAWGVLYAVEPGGAAISLVAELANRNLRTALMRSVRELAMNRAVSGGGLFLHTAAIARGARGLLIAGEKKAGKTTLLLHLLRESGADYVSNDRVLLAAPADPRIRAMPTIVSLRGPTLARFPDLAAHMRAHGFHHRRSLAEAAAQAQQIVPAADGSMSISPAQLCASLGVRAVDGCTAEAILFPRITDAIDGFSLRRLPPGEAAARLRRAWLSADLPRRTSELLVAPGAAPPLDDAQLAVQNRLLLERLTAYECALGPNAYAERGLAEACLRCIGA